MVKRRGYQWPRNDCLNARQPFQACGPGCIASQERNSPRSSCDFHRFLLMNCLHLGAMALGRPSRGFRSLRICPCERLLCRLASLPLLPQGRLSAGRVLAVQAGDLSKIALNARLLFAP
ncbi:MAG: hypothetical protein PHQ34_03000 [Methanothrix sp.]|nr:hypothetical protein [Methanothrix sp.]